MLLALGPGLNPAPTAGAPLVPASAVVPDDPWSRLLFVAAGEGG